MDSTAVEAEAPAPALALSLRTTKERGIKEKIPCGHKEHQPQAASSTTTPRQGPMYHHEKKGVMDKIKEKLPGSGNHRSP